MKFSEHKLCSSCFPLVFYVTSESISSGTIAMFLILFIRGSFPGEILHLYDICIIFIYFVLLQCTVYVLAEIELSLVNYAPNIMLVGRK